MISSERDTILKLPLVMSQGMENLPDSETDNDFLTFSDSNKEISSLKDNSKSGKSERKINIIDNAESVISI